MVLGGIRSLALRISLFVRESRSVLRQQYVVNYEQERVFSMDALFSPAVGNFFDDFVLLITSNSMICVKIFSCV